MVLAKYFLRLTKENRVYRRRAGDHDGCSKPSPVEWTVHSLTLKPTCYVNFTVTAGWTSNLTKENASQN